GGGGGGRGRGGGRGGGGGGGRGGRPRERGDRAGPADLGHPAPPGAVSARRGGGSGCPLERAGVLRDAPRTHRGRGRRALGGRRRVPDERRRRARATAPALDAAVGLALRAHERRVMRAVHRTDDGIEVLDVPSP